MLNNRLFPAQQSQTPATTPVAPQTHGDFADSLDAFNRALRANREQKAVEHNAEITAHTPKTDTAGSEDFTPVHAHAAPAHPTIIANAPPEVPAGISASERDC